MNFEHVKPPIHLSKTTETIVIFKIPLEMPFYLDTLPLKMPFCMVELNSFLIK